MLKADSQRQFSSMKARVSNERRDPPTRSRRLRATAVNGNSGLTVTLMYVITGTALRDPGRKPVSASATQQHVSSSAVSSSASRDSESGSKSEVIDVRYRIRVGVRVAGGWARLIGGLHGGAPGGWARLNAWLHAGRRYHCQISRLTKPNDSNSRPRVVCLFGPSNADEYEAW